MTLVRQTLVIKSLVFCNEVRPTTKNLLLVAHHECLVEECTLQKQRCWTQGYYVEEIGDGPKGALCNEMGPCGIGQPSWDIP
jgi:hypothetical protein